MPTIIELTGAEYPETYNGNKIYDLEGRSLLPIFKFGEKEDPEYMFFEHSNNCAVIHGDWKIIAKFNEFNWQLFNISEDRNEQNDLADKRPELVKQMSDKWHQWAESHKVIPKGTRTKQSYN